MAHTGALEGRDAAYGFTAGKPWGDYNPEQQASIVEAWYKSGMPEDGALWPYIRNNIRKGQN